jgi:hypothetical protein
VLHASPAEASLVHRVHQSLKRYGLAVTQHMMDEMKPVHQVFFFQFRKAANAC